MYVRGTNLVTYGATCWVLPRHPSVVHMHSRGAVGVAVVEDAVPPPTLNEGANMTAGEGIVVYEVATHLPMARGNQNKKFHIHVCEHSNLSRKLRFPCVTAFLN